MRRLLAVLLGVTLLGSGEARESSGVPVGQLPPEVRETLRLIDAGGPFPFRRDGIAFQNRERRLPEQRTDYYHEYTVPTPGSKDRGARRIITGDKPPIVFYYTADHYKSFRRIQR
jgi:ribonuclease T1